MLIFFRNFWFPTSSGLLPFLLPCYLWWLSPKNSKTKIPGTFTLFNYLEPCFPLQYSLGWEWDKEMLRRHEDIPGDFQTTETGQFNA